MSGLTCSKCSHPYNNHREINGRNISSCCFPACPCNSYRGTLPPDPRVSDQSPPYMERFAVALESIASSIKDAVPLLERIAVAMEKADRMHVTMHSADTITKNNLAQERVCTACSHNERSHFYGSKTSPTQCSICNSTCHNASFA